VIDAERTGCCGANLAMYAVTIHDLRSLDGGSVLAFDLVDILRLDERGVVESVWRCRGVESMGGHAAALHAASEGGVTIPGDVLLRHASGVYQVIDGDFAGSRPGHQSPWLVVRAIDSSFFVVASEDEGWLGRIRERFEDVRDAPEEVDSLDFWWFG
jgi:hypothetical protein